MVELFSGRGLSGLGSSWVLGVQLCALFEGRERRVPSVPGPCNPFVLAPPPSPSPFPPPAPFCGVHQLRVSKAHVESEARFQKDRCAAAEALVESCRKDIGDERASKSEIQTMLASVQRWVGAVPRRGVFVG